MDDTKYTAERTRIPAELYTHDLYLSHYLRGWSEAVQQDAVRESTLEAEYLKGYAQALIDLCDHLEAGDALPGGALYERVGESLAEAPHVAA